MKFRRLLIVLGLLLAAAPFASAQSPTTSPAPRRIDLLSMGDWGEAKSAQANVAQAMERYVAKLDHPIAAMLLAGDNFYVPLSGVDDPAWKTLFEEMYDSQRLNFPFYACLGNHDFDQDKFLIELKYAQVHPESRWKMPARWYRIDFPEPNPLVTVLMLDSNQPNLSAEQWAEQIHWLETELAKPRKSAWIICCAHHPLFSNGAAADNGILQRDWGALFQKYHVDFYLCGHEHNLQHLEIPKWEPSFVLAGGGGAHAHPMLRNNRGPFSRSIYGFVHFELTPDKATVHYIGVEDEPLHVFERSKAGEVKTLFTTPSDPAADKPLEVIQGLYDRIRGPNTRPSSQPATQR
jgi:tartrate-resistant acid phosphatase type 5